MSVKKKDIKGALEYVAEHPEWSGGTELDSPAWESVARALFEIANKPDSRVVGAVNRAIRAQKMIFNRTSGTRRAGTHPAQRNKGQLKMADLTGGGEKKDD
jgi:hypothetical protein